MAEETERKYLEISIEELRSRLIALGARPEGGAHFESNALYDRATDPLRARRELLRLRIREWPDRTDARLTFKAPLPDLMLEGRPVKRREELELGLDDARTMHAILGRLGFTVLARYEKIRESWRLEGAGIDLDELPFGEVAEIEAPLPLLARLEKALGLDKSPNSAKSYYALHQEWLAARGLPRVDSFVFTEARRRAVRSRLGLTASPEKDPFGSEQP